MSTEREISLHCARVYIAESKRRGKTDFAFALLRWAANARKRAMQEPRQAALFGATDRESGVQE
jgi:hypothetical protein